MRVISGALRGHKLKTIGGSTVRPTADRVKEAMFNILASKLKGARVLDLFAGSGALGIEAISRGARSVVFVDSNTPILKVLRKNLEHCKISDKAKVVRWNIEKNLNCLNTLPHTFDLVLLDPPYGHGLVAKAIQHVVAVNCLAHNATIVAEHEPGIQIHLSDAPLILKDSRRYGSNQLSLFQFQTIISHNSGCYTDRKERIS